MQLTPGPHFMIHPHNKRKHSRLGMTLLAEIHSLSSSTPQALGTTVDYSPHRRATLLPGQKPSQLLASQTCLSPDEVQIAIVFGTCVKIFESTECRCGKFVDRLGLHGLSCIKNAGCFPRHSAINMYGKSTAPFLSCLAKKLVDMPGDPRERQWLHQHLSPAMVRGNAASILACVQV